MKEEPVETHQLVREKIRKLSDCRKVRRAMPTSDHGFHGGTVSKKRSVRYYNTRRGEGLSSIMEPAGVGLRKAVIRRDDMIHRTQRGLRGRPIQRR